MKFIYYSMILLVASSCAFHNGIITSTQLSNTKKVEYVDIAVGYSSTQYFFGIGGLKKDGLINEAKRNLYLSYPLRPGQSFENLTLDQKRTIIFPYQKLETIIVADVVERDTNQMITYGKNYLDLQNKSNPYKKSYFKLNNEVAFSLSNNVTTPIFNGKIVRLKESSAIIFYINEAGSFKIKNVQYTKLFKSGKNDAPEGLEFKNGDVIAYTYVEASGQTATLYGYLIGMNSKYALVQTSQGRKTVPLSKLKKG